MQERILNFLFELCGSRKYPYSPHGWSMEIPRVGGGVKRSKFPRGMGGWARQKFPGGINVANRTTQTYGKYFDFQRPKTLK